MPLMPDVAKSDQTDAKFHETFLSYLDDYIGVAVLDSITGLRKFLHDSKLGQLKAFCMSVNVRSRGESLLQIAGGQ